MDENFKFIVYYETNKSVPINSVIGTQIVKNYLECIKNGPDSNKIVSTKRTNRISCTIIHNSGETVSALKRYDACAAY